MRRRTRDSPPSCRTQKRKKISRAKTESDIQLFSSSPSSSSSPSIARHASERNIRTYAGSSRSFLVPLPLPDPDPVDESSYSDLRTRWGIDLPEDAPPGMMNDLKSITELRSKGENRRFLDDVGYLFEGLHSSSPIGLRRASALEVVTKLSDPDFNRRAKTSDFYSRAWDKLSAARAAASDRVLDATIAFFAALAARDPHALTEVAHHKEFVPTLVDILGSLDHTKDVLASVLASTSEDCLRSLGIVRTEIAPLRSLAKLVSNDPLLSQPSARFFVSLSLAALPPSLLTDQCLPTLLANLRAELGLLEPRIAAYQSGLALFPPTITDLPSLSHIEASLRLLDSYLLGHWSSADDDSSSTLSHLVGLAAELVSLCVVSATLLQQSGEDSDMARRCLCGAMRVLTLLSHDDQWWSDATLDVPHALAFAVTTALRSQALWSRTRHKSIESFDLLCLALSLIMNWATSSPRVAVLARTQSIDPTCTASSRLCIRSCQCPGQKPILECLTSLHVQYTDDGDDDPPERVFLRGYTAILLGLLIKDEPANQATVASQSNGIKALIAHCHAFLDFSDDPAPPSSSLDVPSSEPTGRHRATWDKRGEETARDVIRSLETLCDRA